MCSHPPPVCVITDRILATVLEPWVWRTPGLGVLCWSSRSADWGGGLPPCLCCSFWMHRTTSAGWFSPRLRGESFYSGRVQRFLAFCWWASLFPLLMLYRMVSAYQLQASSWSCIISNQNYNRPCYFLLRKCKITRFLHHNLFPFWIHLPLSYNSILSK